MKKVLLLSLCAIGFASNSVAFDTDANGRNGDGNVVVVFAEKEGKGARQGTVLGKVTPKVASFADIVPTSENGPLDIDF